jgi:hypothetical protein
MAADRQTGRRHGAAAIFLAGLVLAASAAQAGDGVQFSRDCTRTYVNKQVGENEQWAITWEIYGGATGNVLKLDGGTPSFIECDLIGEDEVNEIFSCRGSDACASPPCGDTQWSLISNAVTIPLSFLFPSGVDPLNPFEACEPAS